MSSEIKLLKSSFLSAFAIFLSRILGLIRSILLAKILGGGALMTAWSLDFTIANFFRRLFGEGVVGTALIPFLRHYIEHEGKYVAREKLSVIFSAISILMISICIITAIISLICLKITSTERLTLTFQIIPIIIPYALLICIIGVISSVLNMLGKFFLPALSALFLNIFLIGALFFIEFHPPHEPNKVLIILSLAVIISGITQLSLLIYLLKKTSFLPIFRKMFFLDKKVLSEFGKIILPGLLGASALQLSMVIDKTFGCIIGDYGVPALTFSDRIVYLPIGIFAISMGSVTLSAMSTHAAKGKLKNMLNSMEFGIRQLLYVCIPIAIFVFFYRDEVIRLLYMRGKFGIRELKETALALKFYVLGIPAFAVVKVTVGAFYAQKDMKTPVKISLFCIAVNIFLNILLISPLKQGGIALATVISSLLNNILLLYFLHYHLKPNIKEYNLLYIKHFITTLLKTLFVSVLSVFIVYNVVGKFTTSLFGFIYSEWDVLLDGLVFVLVFIFFSFVFRIPEFFYLSELISSYIKRRQVKI